MWCHICTIDFSDFEAFKLHIIEEHGKNSESEESENGISDDENAASNTTNCHDLDPSMTPENMSQENGYDSDNSMAAVNQSDDGTATSNSSPEKYHDYDHNVAAESNSEDKPVALNNSPKKDCDDEDMTSVLSTLPRKHNLRCNTGASNKSSKKLKKLDLHSNAANKSSKKLKKIDLCSNTANKSSKKLKKHDLRGNTANKLTVVSNKSPNEQKKCNRHDNTANKSDISNKSPNKSGISNKSPKKQKLSPILKKHVPKKKEKVVSSKKVFPKLRMSAVLHQEDGPQHSHSNEVDHSMKSFNGDSNHVNSQFVPSNSISVSNYVNSRPISNNNSVFLVNPYVGQGVNNYVIGNQAVQPPVYVVHTVVPNSTTSETVKSFRFCSNNILKWLTKHKILCKNIPYPLPISLFNRVKEVHKQIFDHYCTASVSEETSAVLKVYEELDCMIHKHINAINNTLSTF